MTEEISTEKAVKRLLRLFLYAKENSETIINRLREDLFTKRLTKKQGEKINREHTSILVLKTTERCRRSFSEKISRKILNEFYERICFFQFDRDKKIRIFKIIKGRKEAIRFTKFLQRRMKDYRDIFMLGEEEWLRRNV